MDGIRWCVELYMKLLTTLAVSLWTSFTPRKSGSSAQRFGPSLHPNGKYLSSRSDQGEIHTQRGCVQYKTGSSNKGCHHGEMSNIPPRCRLLSAVRGCRGPAHAVKSSAQQQRALWVLSNQEGPPVTAEHFWILTMPAEIWSRIQLGACRPPPCVGSNCNFKTLGALAF